MNASSPCVALVHGWGLTPLLWQDVRAELSGVDVWAADLGFFGSPDIKPPRPPALAVGHSLGVLLLLTVFDWACPVVAVSGFPRFSAASDFPCGVPERMLTRMEKRLEQNPAAALAEFWARIGAVPTPLVPRCGPLAEGLRVLREGDGRQALKRVQLAVAAEDDPLLPVEFHRQSFGTLLRLLPSGGHVLPARRPRDVAQAILEALS